MVDPSLVKRWKIVETCLERARRSLTIVLTAPSERDALGLKAFDKYLDHNELGLAMDTLASIGSEHKCRGGFWRDLERAALQMDLHGQAAEYRERFADAIRNS